MFTKRYLPWALAAIAVWFFVVGCYTKLYRPTVNGAPEAISSETLYDRYDSSAIDTTLAKDESYPGTGVDYYDRWDYWGRYRPMTRWGFDFYNYSPPYYWGYYGWEDYYGYPWWYSGYYDYWWGYRPGTGSPGEPPSKRPFPRRDDTGGRGSPAVEPPPNPPPAHVAPHGGSSTPSRPARDDAKKTEKQRDFGRKRR